MLDLESDLSLRHRIMHALAQRQVSSDGTITRAELEDFSYDPIEPSIRLISQAKGIWNPKSLNATLAVVSSPAGPYADADVEGGLFRYDYQANSIEGDNTKLRRAGELGLPVLLFRGLNHKPGHYVPVFPVFVVHDDPVARRFLFAVDQALSFLAPGHEAPTELERRYAEQLTWTRLHQPVFRGMVMVAYDSACTVCHLRHADLLDAAHIIGDSDDRGDAVVTNGLALCKIHHAAYDRNLLGIDPDHRIHVNRSLLEEVDGPMLRHGLQEMNGMTITLPRRRAERPDRDRLGQRFAEFEAAG